MTAGGALRARDSAADTRLHYRPHLDGLRTVAVYLVVAYHAGFARLSGGFVGVDIFFVLSGFLVTSILLRDLGSSGRIDRRRFYSRRVRRIIPAAIATLVVTAVAYAVIASPADVFQALGGFRAACLFIANWFFIHQATDYFAANVNSNPVIHFWSLAVEEQFYLVWPLLLGGLFVLSRRAGRARWWVIRTVVAALALASVVEALHIATTNLDRAYYGTDTRAYQLLAGALLALTPQLSRLGQPARRVLQVLALPALAVTVLMATSVFSMGAITRGVVVAAVASVLIVALENSRGGWAKRMLSTRPMTALGKVSYGTYLWHWPVIVLLTYHRHLSPGVLFAVTVVAATGLATVSYHGLERPIRTARVLDRLRAPVIAIGFATSVLVGLLLMPAVLEGGSGTIRTNGVATKLNWRSAFFDIPKLPTCYHEPVTKCTIVHGSGPHVLLMGDSIARMWIPAFEHIARKDGLTLSVASQAGCPWQEGIQYQGSVFGRVSCARARNDWYARVVSALHPDVIVLAQHAYDDPLAPNRFFLANGHGININMPGFEQALEAATARSLRALRAPGRELVLLRPPPSPPAGFDPLTCLSTGKAPRSCGFVATLQLTPLERYFRATAAREPDVAFVDLSRFVCPRLPRCGAVTGGLIVWRDVDHITGKYAAYLAPDVESALRRQHVLGPAR